MGFLGMTLLGVLIIYLGFYFGGVMIWASLGVAVILLLSWLSSPKPQKAKKVDGASAVKIENDLNLGRGTGKGNPIFIQEVKERDSLGKKATVGTAKLLGGSVRLMINGIKALIGWDKK